jgi:hypothetical protein
MANNATDVLQQASGQVGSWGRPNKFTKEYAGRNGNEYLNSPWCDEFVTWCAHHAGATGPLPKGDRAYTPTHANDFAAGGAWYSGTSANVKAHAQRGDVVFFDWSGSDARGTIDHVGYVLRNNGDGSVDTIEGNTGTNQVALRVRGASVIAGFGRPKYTVPPPPKPIGTAWPYAKGTFMQLGWMNSLGAQKVQARINALGFKPKLAVDGDFGQFTQTAVRWVQHLLKVKVDGVVGPVTWAAMFSPKK